MDDLTRNMTEAIAREIEARDALAADEVVRLRRNDEAVVWELRFDGELVAPWCHQLDWAPSPLREEDRTNLLGQIVARGLEPIGYGWERDGSGWKIPVKARDQVAPAG